MGLFRDRRDAGRRLADALASRLASYGGNVLVLGLPRGGVPVAYEVARALSAPLDVFVVRKLGTPGQPELAMGAIASGGARVLNDDIVRSLHIPDSAIERVAEQEQQELARREQRYRGDCPPLDVKRRTVILVDDGLATGATMRAAVSALKTHAPARLVVAVPVASSDACASIENEVDEIICTETPQPFYGVGRWYESFPQTSDDEVRDLLEAARSGSWAA